MGDHYLDRLAIFEMRKNMFDLTAHIARQRRQMAAGMIRKAAKEIGACTCPDKRWQALRLLRMMQEEIRL